MSYSGHLSLEQADVITFGAFDYIKNHGKALMRQNDDKRPLLDKVFKPIMTSKHTFIDGEISVNTGRKSEAVAISPYGLDTLPYTEEHQGERLTFTEGRMWMGLLVVEDELRALGFRVKPLAPGEQGIKMPKETRINIVKELAEKLIAREERYDELLDKALHSDGTGTPDITGIRGLFPVTNTTGTIGGLPRSIAAYRHQVVTGLTAGTWGTPGDFRTLLDPAVRQANRFAKRGSLRVGVAGSTAMDALKTFAENRVTFNASASGGIKMDPSISDNAVGYSGCRIYYDPTLDNLSDEEGDATLKKMIFMFNPAVMELAHEEHKETVTPPGETTQMVRRNGLFGRYAILVDQPNAAALVAQVD